ncbi:hypothetical protein BVRB_8g193870 isoform B [Beta vulgaris subsp. vulgaris]|nr:hypothetical protein BVRB_8g193870 isoform B [Beta vulgaris subsp. vulgaris]
MYYSFRNFFLSLTFWIDVPKITLFSLLHFHLTPQNLLLQGFLLWCLHSTFVLGKPGVAYSY